MAVTLAFMRVREKVKFVLRICNSWASDGTTLAQDCAGESGRVNNGSD